MNPFVSTNYFCLHLCGLTYYTKYGSMLEFGILQGIYKIEEIREKN